MRYWWQVSGHSRLDVVRSLSIFDFKSIQKLIASPQFSFCYDALHGVAGAYAKRIFFEELGAKESSLLNCVPKEDFGGGHPDPNLTYAKELVARMGLGKNPDSNPPEFGLSSCRSMPTSAALDVVATSLNLKFFEVPTDWKFFGKLDGCWFHQLAGNFFGNLVDVGLCSVCGANQPNLPWHVLMYHIIRFDHLTDLLILLLLHVMNKNIIFHCH
ncbi:hypothetical protein L1987_81594 [Smallanthus sonchifolius]|uniref:Uncharacterized protein n=1 Tax=Smallanthus sonchifolius TaxID=185202 RepID=A0ACB8YR18_9ASTR|nr:hypothetical protein L1987_81594 [Smallanthus sonchifolius]